MGSILQTNITQFVEQPGRQITRTTGGLDRMTVKLLGPYWLADAQRPAKGSPHPDYPMMFSVSSSTTIQAGALAEISMQYAGRTDTNGGNNFKSEVLQSASISEGEIASSTFFSMVSQVILSGTPSAPGQLAIWRAGLNTYSTRYASLNGTAKYVTNYQPSGPSGQAGASVLWSYERFTGQTSVSYTTLAGLSGPTAAFLSLTPQSLVQSIRPTGWTSQQVIGPWYENTETYSFRYETVVAFV
jgi:hypothetical protein